MRTLYAGVSTPISPGFISRIQLRRAPCTHTYHRYAPLTEGRRIDTVYHTIGEGTFPQAFETFIDGRYRYAEFAIQIEDDRFTDFCEYAVKTAGKHYYPWVGNVGLAIAYTLNLAFNPGDCSDYWRRCSETSAVVAKLFYDATFDGRNVNTITPGMFLSEHLKLERERPEQVWLCGGELYHERQKHNGSCHPD